MTEMTTEGLQRYVGGQAEIQNSSENYIFRGEISEVSVEGLELALKFDWLAKGKGMPPAGWVKADRDDYAISLEMCGVSDISAGRLCIDCAPIGELTILYPKGGSRLDPSKVEGL